MGPSKSVQTSGASGESEGDLARVGASTPLLYASGLALVPRKRCALARCLRWHIEICSFFHLSDFERQKNPRPPAKVVGGVAQQFFPA